jgi:hypothetical protein
MPRKNGHEVFNVEQELKPEVKSVKEKYAELWNHFSEIENKTDDPDVRRWLALAKTNLEYSEAMAAKGMAATGNKG